MRNHKPSRLKRTGPLFASWKHMEEITLRAWASDRTAPAAAVGAVSSGRNCHFFVSRSEVNYTRTPALQRSGITVPGRHSLPGFPMEQPLEDIWFLLYRVIGKIGVDFEGKICEHINQTQALGPTGHEGTRCCLWKANTLIEKGILKLVWQTNRQAVLSPSLAFWI